MTTLLIVDDRPINREVLSLILDDHGYIVLEAQDGLQALELARHNNIDLLITDIAMPTMDGLALVKAFQADPKLSKIPIIFYTGTYKMAEAYRLANASNVRYVLTKPCDPEIILGTIEGVLDPNSQFFNSNKLTISRNSEIQETGIQTHHSGFSDLEKKEKLENINMRLTNLIEISLDMSLEHNVDKLSYILCKGGRQFLHASYAGALIKDPNNPKQYKHFIVTEDNNVRLNQIEIEHFSESLQDLFLSEKIICMHSPVIDMEGLGLNDINLPFSSLLTLPLKTTKAIYGKVYFINKKNRKIFTPGDQRFMMTLVDKFSVNYENLILSQAIEQHSKQLRSNSLGEMASSLAHELNQPLTAISAYIKGCIKRLEKKNEVTPEIFQVLNEINVQAERAGEVIHRIKNFVRKGELFYEPIDINLLIDQTIQLLKQEFQGTVVDIIYTPNKKLPFIELDKIQIQQVILNLLRNAVEAMKEANIAKPQINIKIHLKNNGRLLVRILDNGPGFSEQNASHLFELYFTTKSHGMGLGLAICRSVIEAHSGQLSASVLPRGGSCFQFEIPIKNVYQNSNHLGDSLAILSAYPIT